MADEAVKQAKENTKLKAKVTRKSASSGTKPPKPRHSWEMHALQEFQSLNPITLFPETSA